MSRVGAAYGRVKKDKQLSTNFWQIVPICSRAWTFGVVGKSSSVMPDLSLK
jgi:hypothetical protein